MPWKKGQSGNPGGRVFGSEKAYTEALRIVGKELIDDPGNPGKQITKLRRMAYVAFERALAGESWAMQHISDRLDGKPAQILENSNGGDLHVIVASAIVREQQVVDADYEEAETVPTKLIGTNGTNGSNGHG